MVCASRTDAGKTWQNMGLVESGRIIVDPNDTNTVYFCALGRLAGPHQMRGVYKTTDAGKTWTRSLFVDANTGCLGLSLDAHDSQTLVTGMWQVEMHTWAEFSGGPVRHAQQQWAKGSSISRRPPPSL